MLYNLAHNTPAACAVAARNRRWRSLAWFPEPWTIGGEEVRVMTVRDYSTLVMIGSDVVLGRRLSEEAIAQFLWFLSPEFSPDSELRQVFILEVHEKLSNVRAEIEEYLEFIFLDQSPETSGGKGVTVAPLAGTIHAISSAYGWYPEQVLNLPLPQAFQLLKIIRYSVDPKSPDFTGNEADTVQFIDYINSLPVEEAAVIRAKVNAGETIEIPD